MSKIFKWLAKRLMIYLKKQSAKTPNEYDDKCVKALDDSIAHWYEN